MMTGFVSSAGVSNPLSRMTIGSLADIGYVVNMAPFDSYTVPSTLAAAFSAIREAQGLGGFELREELREPIGTVDGAGRVTFIQPRR